MYVLFTSKIEGEITSFQPYPFHEAVEKTAQLDAKWKKRNNEPVALDFMISNTEGDKLYSGTYLVGSADTTNIYDHVCRKLVQLPMKNNQQETDRDILLQHLTAHTPTSYQLDVTELLKENRDQTSEWKQLSKRARIMTGSITGIAVITLFTSFVLLFMVKSQSTAMETMNQKLASMTAAKEMYETAMAGDVTMAIDQLQTKEERTEKEEDVLVHLLLSQKQYEDAVEQAGKNQVSALASQVMQLHGVEEVEVFQEKYPSPAGAFEIAYHTEAYEEAVEVKEMPMTVERYKEKGLAYLHLDQPKEAKKMASEANSDTLNAKIKEYEELGKQIAQLNDRIENEKKAEEKEEDKIKELEEQKSTLQEEQQNI